MAVSLFSASVSPIISNHSALIIISGHALQISMCNGLFARCANIFSLEIQVNNVHMHYILLVLKHKIKRNVEKYFWGIACQKPIML